MTRFLIVRLGAMGDIVHAVPVAAALRAAMPGARIDWLVSAKHRAILDFVPVIDRRLALADRRLAEAKPTDNAWSGIVTTIRELRKARYDVALDLQGLIKSAVLARSCGAPRVMGFAKAHLREPFARFFYNETHEPPPAGHVIEKNMSMLAPLGVPVGPPRFPFAVPASDAPVLARERLGLQPGERFASINPGGGWPNKLWPVERFGAVAAALRQRHALRSIVLWGPGEQALADAVVSHASGAAAVAPATSIGDLLALVGASALMISGDTGPMHLAAAVGTPIVGIHGPTSPARNGPWSSDDETASRFDQCVCHHERRCRRSTACVIDISVDEVVAAVDRRLAKVAIGG